MEVKKNKCITPTIVTFSFSIIIITIMLFINYNESNVLMIGKSLKDSSFFLIFILFITFPGFALHFRYKIQSRNKKITFKQNCLEIETDFETKKVFYSDVLEIESHFVAWQRRNPWSDYSYVKLNLKNGEEIYYNCLTTSINSDNNLLLIERIKKTKFDDIFPWY